MESLSLKNLSILKKFLFINFIVFLAIGILTLFYLNSVQPTLIKNKTSNHIKTLNNTIENLNRLKIVNSGALAILSEIKKKPAITSRLF